MRGDKFGARLSYLTGAHDPGAELRSRGCFRKIGQRIACGDVRGVVVDNAAIDRQHRIGMTGKNLPGSYAHRGAR